MRQEHKRLGTFAKWPSSSPVSGADLAASGLYFIGPSDRVKCAYCLKKMKNWEEGDDPISEHKRISPFCTFVARIEPYPIFKV